MHSSKGSHVAGNFLMRAIQQRAHISIWLCLVRFISPRDLEKKHHAQKHVLKHTKMEFYVMKHAKKILHVKKHA